MSTPIAGIYPGTPMAEYHRWEAASNSRLTKLHRTPAHLRAYLDEPGTDTLALAIGRAIHSAVLEPDDFATRYVVAEPCRALLKTGARKGEPCGSAGLFKHREIGWACGVHIKGFGSGIDDTVQALSVDDHRVCIRARDAVHVHGSAQGLISGPGDVELSVLWNDEDSGVFCKGRFDRYSSGLPGGAIVDIKTTRDASRREFERSIFSLGYHRQGAFYLAGAEAAGIAARHFVILAVEKEPPFAVAVYRLTEGALSAGEEQIKPLLRKYAECFERNEWPGYPDEVQDIALPDWAWRVVDDELQEVA